MRARKPTLMDFRTLFEATPSPYLVLDPKLVIVAVNDAYLNATRTQRDAILGRHLFEVFPDSPLDDDAGGVENLQRALSRVLDTGESDTMPMRKYDMPTPDQCAGDLEARYWRIVNSPYWILTAG